MKNKGDLALVSCIFMMVILVLSKYMIQTRIELLQVRNSEPITIEKEVIVYVEKEPEEVKPEESKEEIVEEPVIVEQPIDYNFDIMIASGLTSDDLTTALGPIRSGMIPYVDYIIEAEQIYGVNALYLTAVLGFESGWGQYESGANNIAGWKGNDGYFRNFVSVRDCILTVAEGLSTDFVNDVGSKISDVAIRYCPDYGYLDTLLQIMNELN